MNVLLVPAHPGFPRQIPQSRKTVVVVVVYLRSGFVNVHNGQLNPNLRCKRKMLSGLEGLLEIVGLEMMVEGVRTGTHFG